MGRRVQVAWWCAVWISGCAHGSSGPEGATTPTGALGGSPTPALTDEGRRCLASIEQELDPAIRAYSSQSTGPGEVVVYGRTPNLLRALTLAQTEDDREHSIILAGSEYPDTLYAKAYCLIELQRFDEAEATLRKALELIPDDFVYLCELGHIAHVRRDWEGALAIFQRARASVAENEGNRFFGPSDEHPGGRPIFGKTLPDWRTRSMRGIGFSLIELGRLDEAEVVYREILQLDPNDQQAVRELQLIADLRARGQMHP